MKDQLEQARSLGKAGRLEEAGELLILLAADHPDDARLQFECARAMDRTGKETSAVPYYKRAILLGLPESKLKDAYLGLGSTLRTLGRYRQSLAVLEKGSGRFPEDRALQVFRAMTLYNLGEHKEAMRLLLVNLADTAADGEINKYEAAIRFYAGHLDQVWE
ncbi:tetratricopeptide repeat protein [Bhargavaea beijingensis]|nr:tetratricopeptide repeat protein [Bhargavaea beijingensis]MCW1929015.1 tetratricopeptide repeat protein [Bhargavaea beijingensis]RSK34399.1 tetratricopeptide repeat protein [Bhargavaea beijingensis]